MTSACLYGTRHHARRTPQFIITGLVCLILAGCLNVRFVGDYDENIDRGLTSYQEDMNIFLARMASAKGQEARYETNEDFYHRMGAKLETLITRARAMDEEGKCAPAKIAGKGIKAVTEGALELSGLIKAAPESGEIINKLKTVPEGNCTVVVLEAIKSNNDLLQLIHKHNNKLAGIVVKIVQPTIEQGVRIALKNELAKKRGDE